MPLNYHRIEDTNAVELVLTSDQKVSLSNIHTDVTIFSIYFQDKAKDIGYHLETLYPESGNVQPPDGINLSSIANITNETKRLIYSEITIPKNVTLVLEDLSEQIQSARITSPSVNMYIELTQGAVDVIVSGGLLTAGEGQ